LHKQSDLLTNGRYWFSPDGTPAYPFAHNLGSREWVKDERNPLPALGEWDGETFWDNGLPPSPLPLPLLVGTPACIEFGDTPPDEPLEAPTAFTSNSYPAACWSAPQAQVLAFDISECTTVVPFAQAISLLYDDSLNARNFMAALLGVGYSVTHTPNPNAFVPGSVIAVGRVVIVVLAGTSNFQQFAVQGLYLATGIVNFGAFSTTLANLQSALVVEGRIIDAGGTAADEYWFVGHSYGGAIAQVLGARMRLNRPDVAVNVLTFGAPVCGDKRLVDLLAGARQRHYCNDTDPIPGLPVRRFNLDEIIGILGFDLASLWSRLHPPPNRILCFEDFSQRDSGNDFLDFSAVQTIANLIATATALDPFAVHFMGEYLLRVSVFCRGPVAPVTNITFRVIVDQLSYTNPAPFVATFDQILTPNPFVPGNWFTDPITGGAVDVVAISDGDGNWTKMIVTFLPNLAAPLTDHFFWQFAAADMLRGFTTQLFPVPQFDTGLCVVTGLVRLQIIPITL